MNIELMHQETGEAGREYRSVSLLAVIALTLGVASATALAHPLMWWLPAVTALVALVSLRKISRSDGSLAGRALAVVGFCLAVFFFAWAVTRFWVGRSIEANYAQQAAHSWLQLVQAGNLQEAHQWTMSGWRRQPEGAVLSDYYQGDPDAKRSFEEFQQQTRLQLPNIGQEDRFAFQRIDSVAGPRNRRVIRVRFHRLAPGASAPTPVTVGVERRFDADNKLTFWQIVGVVGDES